MDDIPAPPKTIYLQWNVPPDPEFGVTWCQDEINDDDVEYVLAARVEELTELLREALEFVEDPDDYSPYERGSLENKIEAGLVPAEEGD